MSEYKCVERAASASAARVPTTTDKPSKPFCSLAYMAKSTAAINSSKDVRIVKGPGHNSFTAAPIAPNVAATAKVSERGSPGLPTGAATAVSGHESKNRLEAKEASSEVVVNGHAKDTPEDVNNCSSSITEVFGVINEEGTTPAADQVDGVNIRRPWELGTHNGYVQRIPPSLMTPANTQNGFQNGPSALNSLSKLNSLDCWDYTIELECLNGPQGE